MGAAVLGSVVAGVMAVAAVAAPGQCTVSDIGTFDCDVAMDGGGLTFELPDGSTFAFALVDAQQGVGYLIEADAKPGQPPEDLGSFLPVEGEAGCWISGKDYKFCAALAE